MSAFWSSTKAWFVHNASRAGGHPPALRMQMRYLVNVDILSFTFRYDW